MNNRIERRIVIAGAGIAGLSVALAFRRVGHDVIVVERTQSLGTVGAGILVQANGLVVLDALGLGNAVRAAGSSCRAFNLRDRHGHLLLRTDFDAVLPAQLCPISIHRAELHRILWDACAAAGVSLQLGHTVKRVEPNESQPSLVCETGNGEIRISGDFVIGADGVKSVVRDTGGFVSHLDPIVEGSVQGVAPFSLPEHLYGEYFGAGEACGMLPLGGAQTFWFWGGSGKTVSGIEGMPFPEWHARVCKSFPPMHQVLDYQKEWGSLVRLIHRSVRCASWSRGHVILIGDAAHAMSPNLGQGANCALVDALALVCHVEALPANPEKALKQFEQNRRPLVEAIQQRGHEEGVLGTQAWPGAELLFKLLIRLARFTSGARHRAEIRMLSGLDYEGFDLDAIGIEPPVPWLTHPLQRDYA